MKNTVKITDGITWVGASDRRLALFENIFPLTDGVAYNAYIVRGEKIALLDTADSSVAHQYLENIESELDGRVPDYLIINHMEPDHCSLVADLMTRYPNMTAVGTAKVPTLIKQFFGVDFSDRFMAVTDGDSLDLGGRALHFVTTPMVHWPEVMVTYEQKEKILFSADGFGKFGALAIEDDWACEARRYYFNIVGKYGAQVQALLKKAATLDIAMICPLHGPILKENLAYYIDKYNTWSSYEPEDEGVLVAYASIHGNTAEAAKKLGAMLEQKGAKKVVVSDLSREDMAEVIEDAFRYDKIVVAAATYDGGIFPVMEDFLHHLKSKNYQKRTVGIMENGSWAPTAGKQMKEVFETMKNITLCEEMVSIKSTMNDATVEAMERLADELIAK